MSFIPRVLAMILGCGLVLAAADGGRAQTDAAGESPAPPLAGAFALSPEADPDVIADGYFAYELAAGAEATGSVRLENPGEAPVTVELAAVDAETAQAGGSAFAAIGATPGGAGTWLRLDRSRVTLEPGAAESVAFSVAPPPSAAPGQYLAGIAAFVPAQPDATRMPLAAHQVGARIALQTRYVLAVQVDVPGEWTPALTIVGVESLEQPSGSKVGIALRNDGDTFLKPEGSLTLSDAAATPVLAESIALGTVLPGTEIVYPVAWPAPRSGAYDVDVALRYGDGQTARYQGTLTVLDDDARAPRPTPATEAQPTATPVPVEAAAPPQSQPRVLFATVGLLGVIAVSLLAFFIRSGRPRW